MLLPKEMELLIDFMRVQKKYSGSNTEFCERYNEYAGQAVSARGLKRLMNLWEYRLADFGVRFRSHRSNGARLLEIEYSFSAGDESAVNDAKEPCGEICVPSVPCVPDTREVLK